MDIPIQIGFFLADSEQVNATMNMAMVLVLVLAGVRIGNIFCSKISFNEQIKLNHFRSVCFDADQNIAENKAKLNWIFVSICSGPLERC